MSGLLGYGRVLVVTAVEAERAAVLAGLGKVLAGLGNVLAGLDNRPGSAVEVIAGGVGSAAAAARTGAVVAVERERGNPFDAVISTGIGGGFAAPVGAVAIATETVAADLGADSPDGFVPLDDLGFGTSRLPVDGALFEVLAGALPHACTGPVLTVNTVTGTAAATARLLRAHPDAAAEAMEGFGVAMGAAVGAVPFAEIRAISNAVGPRDRGAWRIPQALDALRDAFATLATVDR